MMCLDHIYSLPVDVPKPSSSCLLLFWVLLTHWVPLVLPAGMLIDLVGLIFRAGNHSSSGYTKCNAQKTTFHSSSPHPLVLTFFLFPLPWCCLRAGSMITMFCSGQSTQLSFVLCMVSLPVSISSALILWKGEVIIWSCLLFLTLGNFLLWF